MVNPDDDNNNNVLGATSTTTTSTATATATTTATPTPTAAPTTGLFGTTSTSIATTAQGGAGGEASNNAAPDEDYSKEYEPVVRLAEVETRTGEEEEEVLFKIRAKLFRFSKELGEWKERGTGDVRVLEHKENHKIRLLMRREKTLKICLNHYVNPSVELKENVGSDRSWVWHGVDYADGERDHAMLAIRFRDSDNADKFKSHYDEARKLMSSLKNGDVKDADAGAKEAENGNDNKEEKEEEKKEEEEEDKKEEAA